MRIKGMESQINFLLSEAKSSKDYADMSAGQIGQTTSYPTFNSGMYRSGMQTPRHALAMEESMRLSQQRRSMVPSAARTRQQSPPPAGREHTGAIPAKLMQPRQAFVENLPKQIRRPPHPHQYQKPPMIDLRDDPENLKLGKRMVAADDVENIDEESPRQHHRHGQKLIKR